MECNLAESDDSDGGFAGSPIFALFYVYRLAVGDFDFGDFEGD